MKLVITGIGMASPLGKHRDGCAAVRAGLIRTREIAGLSVTLDDELYSSPILGSSCAEAEGFQGYSRLAYLTASAIKDLKDTYRNSVSHCIKLYVKLPDSGERPTLFSHLNDINADDGSDFFKEVLTNFLSNPEFGIDKCEIEVFEEGKTGICSILNDAAAVAGQHSSHTVLIAAVDSFLDSETAESFLGLGRVMVPGGTSGFLLSEGAGVIMIESEKNVSLNEYDVLLTLGKNVYSVEEYLFPTPEIEQLEKPSLLGTAVTNNLLELADSDEDLLSSPICGFYDFNGERDRAVEWGNALSRIPLKYRNLAEVKWLTPLISTGNCGNANGIIAICCAAEGKRREYLKPPFIIHNSYDSGLRETFLLR